MEAGLLSTSMEEHEGTWKQFVASVETVATGATCMQAGLTLTPILLVEASMEVDGSR